MRCGWRFNCLSTLHMWNIGILRQSACRHPHTHIGCAHTCTHIGCAHTCTHIGCAHTCTHIGCAHTCTHIGCAHTCTHSHALIHIHVYIHLCSGAHRGGRTEVYRPALNGLNVNTLQSVTALSSIEEDVDAVKYEVRYVVSCEELCSLPSSS